MYIELNAIDTNQDTRQFFFQFDKLENSFEFLNQVVNKGDILISVDLIEDDQRTSLPIEAFDGISFLPGLEKLELEWISILTKPFQSGLQLDWESTYWYKEKLSHYEQSIISLELMISDVSRHCELIEDSFRTTSEVIINRYQSIRRRYEAQLNQAYLMRRWLLNRLP